VTTEKDHGKVSAEFDRYSASYGDLLADPMRSQFASDPLYFHRKKVELISAMLRDQDKDPGAMRWLDVGCGQGNLLRLGRELFAEASGCDPASTMLPEGSDIAVHVQPSPEELPFADQSMDFVTAVCVFHHVHGAARVVLAREIQRVLAPGGYFCLIEHNPWNPVTRGIVKRCPVDVDAELLTAPEARELFSSAGMSPVQTRYFLFVPEKLKLLGFIESLLGGLPLGGQFALLCR
jgi:ubiquinone/menaquinone biosynthesis C-methylase UbiE